MPEIVQGALIGIGGAIVGAIIAAISSYRIARSQIDARRYEIEQQFKYKEKEARINRLIEAQREHLNKLRKTISEYMENSIQATNMIARFDKAFKEGGETRIQENTRELFQTMEQGKNLMSQLNALRNQLSDNVLDDMINTVLEKQFELGVARMPLVEFFNDPKGADSKTIESARKKEETLIGRQRQELIKINKRIEELLSGESSN